MNKKNVAVVMGGYSDEYIVSLKSGQLIFDSLDRSLYEVYKVVILKDEWYYLADNDKKYPINKADFSVLRQLKVTAFEFLRLRKTIFDRHQNHSSAK